LQNLRNKDSNPHSVDLSEGYHFNNSAPTQNRSKHQASPSPGMGRTYRSTKSLSEEHNHSRHDNSRQHKPESENIHHHLLPSLPHERNYYSTQNLSSEHFNNHHSRHSSNSQHGHNHEKTMSSKSNLQHFPSLSLGRNYHSTQNLSQKSSQYDNIERPRSVNFSLEEPVIIQANYTLVPSTKNNKHHDRVKNITEDSTKLYNSTGNIYKSVTTERSSHDEHKPHHLSIEDVSQLRSGSQWSTGRERKSSGQLIFSSEKPKTRIESEFSKINSCTTRQQSRKIPIEIDPSSAQMTPIGSPSTKYNTRVFVN